MTPAQKVASVLAACALITPAIVKWEGWENRAYLDVVNVSTACAGSTKGVVKGKTYTDQECMDRLARDVVEHAMQIDRCIKVAVPAESRAAFISLAYNVGTAGFCSSTLVKKLNAGDLAGACAEIPRWNKAGGRVLPGLVKRRAEELGYCQLGLPKLPTYHPPSISLF
jgi:lysozyme